MNIKQTKSGSFTLLVSVQKYTKIPNDKRRLTGKTKSEVKEKFVALMNEMEKGLFSIPSNASFEAYLEKYKKEKSNN